jgi:hypothetical protein
MALSDDRAFLEDLILRYDPDTDLSEGSRAQTQLIEPILTRTGIDPFDEDIEVFVRNRVRQSFPDLAITEADDLTDVLIDPIKVLIEPLVREVKLVKLRASLRNLSSLSDDEVDALMGNFFAARLSGGYAVGVVRVFFSAAQSVSITQTSPATTRSGLRFFPTRPQQITADQMLLNVSGSEYYFDINYTAENRGEEYNVEPGDIVSVANVSTATRVVNLRRFRGGTAREASTDFAARVQESLSDKTLTVERGINATLTESFPAVKNLFVIGFRDPEMQRDVIEGGGLGPVPSDDTFGHFYGLATAVDDLNGNSTTPIFDGGVGANFVSRLGSVGSSPTNWYATLVYTYGGNLVVVDAQVLSVVSNTQIRVDHEIPLAGVTGFSWMLREKKLTISNIPGGITLPDTVTGTLEIRTDQVHIGGKTDVYLAGETEAGTAAITGITDESPVARGLNAQTASSDLVTLPELTSPGLFDLIIPGMSLVLEEGDDAGSYLIIEKLLFPNRVRLAISLTSTQSNLSFKVIDEIDVNLTDPRAVKLDGSDLLTSAGSNVVTTASASNFLDANVQNNDILEVVDTLGGGEFTITGVTAVNLTVTPVLPRTLVGAAYSIFRRSTAVQTPVVRVSSLELLDSAGAPTGTLIPYSEPVLVVSNAFQNEGSGFPFDNIVIAGLVTVGVVGGGSSTLLVGGTSLTMSAYDPAKVWNGPLSPSVVTLTFSGGPALSLNTIVSQINADVTFASLGIRATVLSYGGKSYVGFICDNLVKVVGGTSLATFGLSIGMTNAQIVSMDPFDTFVTSKVDRTDLVEFITGNNAGTVGRVITEPDAAQRIVLGSGPLGPEGTSALYNNLPLRPDVGSRARAGRPSVGSARVYFLGPTSAEFSYSTTRFTAIINDVTLRYQPDPENTRVLLPAYPNTDLPNAATTASGPNSLVDTAQNFLLQRIMPGDVVQVLYRPIVGTTPLSSSGNILVGGTTLILKLDSDPYITISFPFDKPRADVVTYINTRVGVDIASLDGTGRLVLRGSHRIEIDPASTSLGVLFISTYNTDHPDRGEYIVSSVAATTLSFSASTPLATASVTGTHYRIFRYFQRISSTEMNSNLEASGLYYAEVQMVSLAPGDAYNIATGVEFTITGQYADGYRLTADNPVTSYSRAEVLRAHISPSILLVGSSDSPEEYVQIAQQNVQVAYDRSQVADDVQSFCDSDLQRVVCEEILVRHLLPHYVSLSWSYVGGSSEPDMRRALSDLLDGLKPGDELEVGDMVDELRRRGATSVYTPDTSSATGREAPIFVVIYHNLDRAIRGTIVRDFVDTVRAFRFIPDNVILKRVSPGGIR